VNFLHELGVVIEVVKTIERIAAENQLESIDTLVLQIGQLSAMIPKYIEAVYPAAVDGTILQDTKLKIEVIPANGRCKACATVFGLIENNGICPKCGSGQFELLCGKEFLIKEILVS
jgi:hydrogenase nickel incorporation protein HypA/HybF